MYKRQLLPSFQGAHGIQDAFDRGVKVTGVTVHIANAVYDMGPIIAQRSLVVEEDWDCLLYTSRCV